MRIAQTRTAICLEPVRTSVITNALLSWPDASPTCSVGVRRSSPSRSSCRRSCRIGQSSLYAWSA